jgi:hypothetical protein
MAQDDDSQTSLTRSLSARLRRKEQVARGETIPEMPEDTLPPGMADQEAESDEEAALSDEELLAKYGVEDPEVIEDEDKLDSLLQGQFPDRIRQMALRRMWRLNPLFRFADEMVEYGENYTDAATVIDGMTTAYQVGKGYLQKAFNALDDEEGDAEEGDQPGSGDDQPAQPAAQDDPEKEADKTSASDAEQAAGDTEEKAGAVSETGAEGGAASEATLQPIPMMQDESPVEDPPRPRPQRMTFRRPAG